MRRFWFVIFALGIVGACIPAHAAGPARSFRSDYQIGPHGETLKYEDLRLFSNDGHLYFIQGYGCEFKLVDKQLSAEEEARLGEFKSGFRPQDFGQFKLIYTGVARPTRLLDPSQDGKPVFCHDDHLALVMILVKVKGLIPNEIPIRLLLTQGKRPTSAKSTFFSYGTLLQQDWLAGNSSAPQHSEIVNSILEGVSELIANLATGGE